MKTTNEILTEIQEHSTNPAPRSLPPERPSLALSLLGKFNTKGNPERKLMRDAALEFCAELQARRPARWLTLCGPSGTGKTLLAKIVMQFVRDQGCQFRIGSGDGKVVMRHQHYWANWPAMVQEMKAGNFGSVQALCEMEEKWNGAQGPTFWFEVIDDIGQLEDTAKGYLMGALSRIADARLGHWTVWTSNLSYEQIAQKLDERISSRMIRGGNVVVENHCLDYNLL